MIRSRVFRAVAASLTIAALSLTAACGSAPAEKKAAAAENGKTVTPGSSPSPQAFRPTHHG